MGEDIQSIIDTFANEHDIIAGICDAAPIDSARLMSSPFVPFVNKDISKRTNPALIFPPVKSIIAVGVGQKSFAENFDKAVNNKSGDVQLSSLGADEDYHIHVREITTLLKNELEKTFNFNSKILVDSGTLDERIFASRAGLGFFGRNGLLISEKFGTRFNIGLLLTNIVTMHHNSIELSDVLCKCPVDCRRCIESCPGNALGNTNLDASNCISYLTQKDELTAIEREKMRASKQIYGCDICQDSCPFNLPRKKTFVNPQEWLEMTDTEFSEKYSKTAMLWRGTKILRRNANVFLSGAYND